MIALMSQWDPRAYQAAWWWRPIQPAKRKAGWASRVRASSTNSSLPICRGRRSLLPTSSSCICIVVPSSLFWQMKTKNKTRIAGVVTPLAERRAWQIISQWVWNLRLELGHQLSPDPVRTVSRLLLPFRLPHRTRLLPRTMLPLKWACPGNKIASLVKTFLSSRMGRSVVQLASRL